MRLIAFVLAVLLALPAAAQQTGQTLEDILARQNAAREEGTAAGLDGAGVSAGDIAGALQRSVGAEGPAGDARLVTQSRSPGADVLIQSGGMRWLQFREGPLLTWGGGLLLGTIVLLAAFFILRGRIRIEGPITGRTVLRFRFVERLTHWVMALSFLALSLTGLLLLFGRAVGLASAAPEVYAALAQGSKWIHNNVSWAFMVALVFAFLFWVAHNIPSRLDWQWLKAGGGLFTRGHHPPARKFNAGQKIIFWAVMILGASISASGLSLLFPFELPMFAKTFGWMNAVGFDLPTALSPQEEMQYAQAWHAIVGFVFMAIALAHIYLGSIGMQGAYAAMGTGRVEEQWAREHHSLWLEEVRRTPGEGGPAGQSIPGPAE